jgi:hypothetical protein
MKCWYETSWRYIPGECNCNVRCRHILGSHSACGFEVRDQDSDPYKTTSVIKMLRDLINILASVL